MRARSLICKMGNAFLPGLLQGRNSQFTSLKVNRHRKLLAQGLTQRWLNNCKTEDFPGVPGGRGTREGTCLRAGPLPSRPPPPLKDSANDSAGPQLLLPPRSSLGQKTHREAPGKGVPSWPGGVAGAPRLQMQEARLGAGWLRGR